MARLFDDAQNEYFIRLSPIHDDYAIAMLCWFKADDITNGYVLMWTGDRTVNNENLALYIQGSVAGDPVRLQMNNTANPVWRIADTTAGYTANTWHHACGIWVDANELRVFLDGGNRGTSLAYATINENSFTVGVLGRLAKSGYMSGCIAEVAFYNLGYWPGITLSDKADNFEKILPSLAKGFSPLLFPLGLIAYWPLIRGIPDSENDIIGKHYLTAVNSPSMADHPRVILPQQSQLTTPLISGAFTTIISSAGPKLTAGIISNAKLQSSIEADSNLTTKIESTQN